MLGDEIKATPKTTSGKSIVSLNEPVLQVAISDTYQLVVVGMYGKIVILEDMRLDLSKTMSRVIQSPITSRVTSSIVCQEMIYIATMQGVWEYDIQNKTGCNRMVAIDEVHSILHQECHMNIPHRILYACVTCVEQFF